MTNSTPQYSQAIYDHHKKIEAQRRNRLGHMYDPKTCLAHATFQGLLALGWVALGRASVQNGWPLCFVLSVGILKGELEES